MTINTTAINQSNVAVDGQSGKVGNVRYVQKNGRTYVRVAYNKTSKKTNPRTDKQMYTRLKHNSMLAIWKVLSKYLGGAFNTKEQNQSDCNAFMQRNAGKGCYMTKAQYADGMCIAVPGLIYSDGELSPLAVTLASADASLGINASGTTWPAVSQYIIDHNDGWEDGDVITVIALKNSATSPYGVSLDVRQCTIDSASTMEALPTGFSIADSKLVAGAIMPSGFAGSVFAIHGRGTMVSKSSCADVTTVYDLFVTADQFKLARDSYGKALSNFLGTGTGTTAVQSPASDPTDGPANTPTPTPAPMVTVTVNQSPNGAGEPTGAGVYVKGTTVTVTANPIEGWYFSMWQDGDENATRTFVANEDTELTAVYSRSQG